MESSGIFKILKDEKTMEHSDHWIVTWCRKLYLTNMSLLLPENCAVILSSKIWTYILEFNLRTWLYFRIFDFVWIGEMLGEWVAYMIIVECTNKKYLI